MLVGWLTSDYDEKWGAETNAQQHYAFLNADGEMLVDVTDTLLAVYEDDYQIKPDALRAHGFYQDGMAYVMIGDNNTGTSGDRFVILDESGNALLSSRDFYEGGKLGGLSTFRLRV